MKTIQEYIKYSQKPIFESLDEVQDYSIFLNVFNKIDIYNKNTKFIAEGYTQYSNHITYTLNEQCVIGYVLENYMQNILLEYIGNSNLVTEGLSLDKAKDLITSGKEKINELIERFKNAIPTEVLEAYEFLIKVLNNGIKTVKDLLKTIGKLLEKLGETVLESLEKLKLFNDEYCGKLPDSDIDTHDIIEFKNENQKKLIGFIINEVNEKVKEQQKENDVNEGKVGKTVAALGVAGGLAFAPGLTLLACGGFGLYKLLKYIGPKLSEKLEPYLLSDKSKEFVDKLYNNKFARYSIGLKKTDDNEKSDSKLKTFGKIVWSIIVNLIIATIVSSILTLFVTAIIGSGPATGLIIAVIIGGKNIFKIILNRILNFKKETVTKDGTKETQYFFDMVTMIGILSSVVSIVAKIPGFNEWFKSLLDKIFNFGLNKANAGELADFDPEALKTDVSDYDSEDLGNFESVKRLLDETESIEDPVYGSSNVKVASFLHRTSTWSQNNDTSEYESATTKVITSLSKSSDNDIIAHCAKSELSKDNIRTSLIHVFRSNNTTHLNEIDEFETSKLMLQFVKLHGKQQSNVGFKIWITDGKISNGDLNNTGKVIKGILSPTGKILKIKGANSLRGKHWDDLTRELVQ